MTEEDSHGVDASEWTPPADADDEWVEFAGEATESTDDDGTESGSGGDSNEEASSSSGELERPPDQWRGDGDPTGSRGWVWLTRATLFSGLVLAFWTVPVAVSDVADHSSLQFLGDGSTVVLAGLILLAVLVRLVVLPVLLFRDSGKLRDAEEVDWRPNRAFYMVTGAVFATLVCGYYLFKRQRHVGNPTLLNNDEFVYFEGRTVRSNWFRLLVLTPALTATSWIGSLLEVVEGIHPNLSTAVMGPVVLLLVLTILLRFVLLPVAFYRDAAAVTRAGAQWEPNGTLYAVIGYVFAIPTVLVYLYRRHRHTEGLF